MDPLSISLNSNGDPNLFPNEEIYIRQDDLTMEAVDKNDKIQNGRLFLTTHRLIFAESSMVLVELPLHYVKKIDTGGGIFHSLRVEVYLDEYLLNSGHPPHFVEYQYKVLKKKEKEIPSYKRQI